MATVKVLIPGKHIKKDNRVQIGATTSLILSDKKIIVDPGIYSDEGLLVEVLAKEDLKPEDIEIVVLTHTHLDHAANAHVFKNSRIYCKFMEENYTGQYHVPKEGYLTRTNIGDGEVLAEGVEFLLTPGHVGDHISLIVNTEEGKVVVAGDAIASEKFIDLDNQPPLFVDLDKYNASRKKILAIADIIIPGHGDIIKLKK